MWKLIRTFIRKEVLDWVKREFTEAKIRKLVEKALKAKLGTKKMRTKLGVGMRLSLEQMGFVVTAADAQVLVGDMLDDLVEQML